MFPMSNKTFCKILIVLLTLVIQVKSIDAKEIKIGKHKISLDSKYKWIENSTPTQLYGTPVKVKSFAAFDENNFLIKTIETTKVERPNRYGDRVRAAIISFVNSGNRSEQCVNNEKYLYFELNNRGYNCLIVRKVQTEIYFNYSNLNWIDKRRNLKNLFRKNDINEPIYMLRSDHIIVKGSGETYWISYMINPDSLDSDLNNLKKQWINLSLKRHSNFQDSIGLKRKLNLNYPSFDKSKSTNQIEKDIFEKIILTNESKNNKNLDNKSIVEEIKQLDELYKNGALSKDEFEAAKKILLKK